jgi:hypothetical protein
VKSIQFSFSFAHHRHKKATEERDPFDHGPFSLGNSLLESFLFPIRIAPFGFQNAPKADLLQLWVDDLATNASSESKAVDT